MDNRTDLESMRAASEAFLKKWNEKVSQVLSDPDRAKAAGIDHEMIALVAAIVLGIKSNIQQEEGRRMQGRADDNILKLEIGHSLFNLTEFIRVDINGKEGLRKSHPKNAGIIERFIREYINAITQTGVKILDRLNQEIKLPPQLPLRKRETLFQPADQKEEEKIPQERARDYKRPPSKK